MPFVALREGPHPEPDLPPAPLQLAYYSAREVDEQAGRPVGSRLPRWQLRTPFGYLAEDGRYFAVPAQTGDVGTAGNYTDLASVPSFLWGILGPYGRQLRPALLHDHLCDVADGVIPPDPRDRDSAGRPVAPGRSKVAVRTEADYLFREALRSEGVGPVRSWLFWTGVSFGRFAAYARGWAIALGVLAALFAVLALHAVTVVLGGGPRRVDGWLSGWTFWLVLLAIAAVLAALRRGLLVVTVPLSLVAVAACLAGADPDLPGWSHSLAWHAAAAAALLIGLVAVGSATDVRVALTTAVVVPVILPVVLVTTLAQLTLALPDLIRWASRGYRGDEPVTGPLFGPPTPGS